MKIFSLGHAGFRINLENKVILIDPWISNNPSSPYKKIEESLTPKCDYIFVTHEHQDHGLEDAINLCKLHPEITLIGILQLVQYAKKKGVKNIIGASIGGQIKLNDLLIYIAPAIHPSTFGAVGFVIKGKNETIFHTGDTAFYSDLKLLRYYQVDVAFLPIGDYYTMGIKWAKEAVKAIKPRYVIPMHYDTFPEIKTNLVDFKKQVGKLAKVEVINPGKEIEINFNQKP